MKFENQKLDEIKDKLRTRVKGVEEGDYVLDSTELGKILIIASTALLLVSIHAALNFQDAASSMEKTNKQFERASGVINSDNFQESMNRLEGLGSDTITRQVRTASSAFETADQAIQRSVQTEKDLERHYSTFQWLALIAIMGEVAGIAVIYV